MATEATMTLLYPRRPSAGFQPGALRDYGETAAASPEQLRAAADYFAAQGDTAKAAALRKQADELAAAIAAAAAKQEPSGWATLNTFITTQGKQALDWYKTYLVGQAIKAGDESAIKALIDAGATPPPTGTTPTAPPTTAEKGISSTGYAMIAVGAAAAIGAVALAFSGGRRRNPPRRSRRS